MNAQQFRSAVKDTYPWITVTIKTVSFSDLARSERKTVTIKGERTPHETAWVNALAQHAGILPDGNVKRYPTPEGTR